MDRANLRRSVSVGAVVLTAFLAFVVYPHLTGAAHNILSYKDTISDSRPLGYANHTLEFTLHTDVSPSGYIEVEPPAGFDIRATSTFDVRDVELYVNGIARTASNVLDTNVDQVIITTGSPGLIRYNLNPTTGISSGSNVKLIIGNITSTANHASVSFSTTTGTTTVVNDVPPIRNGTDIGTQKVHMTIGGGTEEAYADFSIAIVNAISMDHVDTTELVPPYRFNGAPSGEVGGTTLTAEISLETDELAVCKYSLASGTPYASMTHTFSFTGKIIHSQLVQIATSSVNNYYVRCIDDEGNFNTDDYLISFIALPPPTGVPNDGGDIQGDGSGSGNTGTGAGGTGSGSSGSGGGSSGGSSGGSGGSGGGSGGTSGSDSTDISGGGFEINPAAYRSGDAQVIISGNAFPNSTVFALVDGNNAASVHANSSGGFSITLDAIAKGVYTFGVYAVDSSSIKSSTFSTSFTVTGGRTSNLSNITIMPSIAVSPDPVDPGKVLHVSGFSIPNADITIENQSDKSSASLKAFTAVSNSSGKWSLDIDTTGFTAGTYKIHAKSKQATGLQLQTSFSDYTYYGVGAASTQLTADLNKDGKVNLTDFSILLFWWGGDGGNSNPPADINRDGSVSLTDFSIMLFNWTG